MILYRAIGSVEMFKDCGMLPLDPIVMGSKTAILKKIQEEIKYNKKNRICYRYILQEITVKAPTKVEWIQALSSGFTDDLIFGEKFLHIWEKVKYEPKKVTKKRANSKKKLATRKRRSKKTARKVRS